MSAAEVTIEPTIAQRILALVRPDGRVEAEDVVSAASDPDHPLHDRFEWDDAEAGRKFRLVQARLLIRACVSYEAPNIPVRVFASLSTETGYRPLSMIVRDPGLRDQLIADAAKDMAVFKQRYQHIAELGGVIRAMDAVRA